ncbi:MAG TPA: hypothetical protein V6D06_16950 [Trichocoleus sp.]
MTGTPEPQPKSLKNLLFSGIVGATALAGTTAIPILVQQFLGTPAPNTVPAQTLEAPASVTSQTVAPNDLPQASGDDVDDDTEGKGKGKKKRD